MLLRSTLFYLLSCALTVFARPFSDSSQAGDAAGQLSVRQLYQFSNGSFLENIAVRSNGNILVTRLDVPELYEFAAPDFSTPRLVYRFPQASGVGGIAEITPPDTFAVVTYNISLVPLTLKPGNFSIWTVDLRDNQPVSPHGAINNGGSVPASKVRKIAQLSQLKFANGLLYVPEADGGSLLLPDSALGSISKIRLADGNVTFDIITDPLFRSASVEGINGLKRRGLNLYFTNSNLGIFGRVPFDPRTGRATGPSQSIGVISDKASYPNNDYNDDLAIDMHGRFAYYAGATSNTILRSRLEADDGHGNGTAQQQLQQVIAGSPNSTEIAEPTAVAFGRTINDRSVLYVVTAGGQGGRVSGNPIVGAQLLAIDLKRQ